MHIYNLLHISFILTKMNTGSCFIVNQQHFRHKKDKYENSTIIYSNVHLEIPQLLVVFFSSHISQLLSYKTFIQTPT